MKVLDEAKNLAPPRRVHTVMELLAPFEWCASLLTRQKLSGLPRGQKQPVMLAPGYMTDEWSMRPLKRFLTSLNYQAFDWGLGRNRGQVDKYIAHMAEHIRHCQQSYDIVQPFTLIGWSLGGVISREVARLYPDLVQEVITLGSPISGGPKYTALANRYASRETIDLDEFEKEVLSRNRKGISQPVTAIYSKTDGIVGWQAARDIYNTQARNIEVKATHLALGVNTSVWQIIAKILAEKPHEKPKTPTLTLE
ncbi:alpha/beta hydrolase [Alteromonas sediminis]|uniref:Alpha/beta hydrolase n=1 Tax=Alteromonas sediminis TaxID=2259342 RepID=A0A3N5Y4M8_9ALTE|nr:alpha/beta hydrolase [Alteromonas sediminis]RPJ65129.1 alpha/beta hydrolase [Alteromonas sediminis]